MKSLRNTLIAALAITITSASFGIVSMDGVIGRVSAVVSKIEEQDEQPIFVQIDNIEKDVRSTQTYTLQADSTYKVIAVGDDKRVKDIDLRVLDENDNEIGKDDDDQNIALVTIKPKWTGKFKIQVWAAEMKASDAFYGIIIARE